MYANVALPIALKPLTYRIPDHLAQWLEIGMAVSVPLRNKRISGYISKINQEPEEASDYEFKEIFNVDEKLPRLEKNFLQFMQWISDYYHYPLGEVIQSALPAKTELRNEKIYSLAPKALNLSPEEINSFAKRGGKRNQLIELFSNSDLVEEIPAALRHAFASLKKEGYILENLRECVPAFLHSQEFPNIGKISHLNEEQSDACATISAAIDKNTYKSFLLQGVTGSGKTEVYLSAAEHALALGKTVLILVPEISLTPQLLARVRSRLGSEIAVLHSALTENERTEQWNLIHRGIAKVALGARSTIFAPMQNIGLIIIDEEHETAFKQEDRLRYNAKDMAMLRARIENSVIILGSATPSLESFHHVLSGKLEKIYLHARYAGRSLPKMEIVDLRNEKMTGSLSGRLTLHLQKTLSRKKQAMLFLNRRGYSSFVICSNCGDVPNCPNCSVSLTHYQGSNSLQCHYCDYNIAMILVCPGCNSKELSFGGLGTESLEIELQEKFPAARTVRIDRETTAKRGELEKKLRGIASGEYDIIIGTQMIAKGHDFPNIELAAIINADVTLNVPDFRSSERAFQLFTQVAGRAGRGDWEGLVILQTYDPNHPSIQHAKNNSYEEFCREELEKREMFHYPPYFRIARIVVSDNSDQKAKNTSQSVAQILKRLQSQDVEVIGPAPAVLHKLLNKYRWNILIKCKKAPALNSLIKTALPLWKKSQQPSTNISIDVDPISLL